MERQKVRIGIIGTGRIARRFIKEIVFVEDVELTAIYNPHKSSAKKFLENIKEQEFDAADNEKINNCKAYDMWEKFIENIDAVYIASPHETHIKYIYDALNCDRHVLCEKPMSLNRGQLVDATKLAKKKNKVLIEGIKTSYAPGFVELIEKVKQGIIGEVRDVQACFTKLENPEFRELTDEKYGGSMLELGSYVLLPIIKIYGTEFESIRFDSIVSDRGIDLYTKIIVKHKDGFATGKIGLGVKNEGQLIIAGTKGYIKVDPPWWKTTKYEICYEDMKKNKICETEFLGDGLRYEIQYFVDKIYKSNYYSSRQNEILGILPFESIKMAEIMEDFMTNRDK